MLMVMTDDDNETVDRDELEISELAKTGKFLRFPECSRALGRRLRAGNGIERRSLIDAGSRELLSLPVTKCPLNGRCFFRLLVSGDGLQKVQLWAGHATEGLKTSPV